MKASTGIPGKSFRSANFANSAGASETLPQVIADACLRILRYVGEGSAERSRDFRRRPLVKCGEPQIDVLPDLQCISCDDPALKRAESPSKSFLYSQQGTLLGIGFKLMMDDLVHSAGRPINLGPGLLCRVSFQAFDQHGSNIRYFCKLFWQAVNGICKRA